GPPGGAQANTGAPQTHGGVSGPTSPMPHNTARGRRSAPPSPASAPDSGGRRPARIVSPEGERVREPSARGVSGYFAIAGAIVLLLLAALLGIIGLIMTTAATAIGAVLIVLGVLCFV